MHPDPRAIQRGERDRHANDAEPNRVNELLAIAEQILASTEQLLSARPDATQKSVVISIQTAAQRILDLVGQPDFTSNSQGTTATDENPRLAELQSLGGEDFVTELMAEFHLQVESDMAEIHAAAKALDFAELRRLAHRLKGSSTTVGMTKITQLCNEVERVAALHDQEGVKQTLTALESAVRQSRSSAPETKTHVRILIADDHPVVRFGVRRMLQSHGNYLVVGEAADGKEAIREMREMQPDLLLLDLNMPLLPGLETLRELTTIQVPTKTVLLTSAISPREILEALQLGARGVVLKDALTTDLSACIATVMRGHYWLGSKQVTNLVEVLNSLMEEIKEPPRNTFGLTSRELEVVRLIAQGMTNKDIAQSCAIAEETVKRHLKNIFDKVGVWNRLELALFAINNHLAAEPGAAA